MSISKAMQQLGRILARNKIFGTYKALKAIAWSDIELDAVYLRSQVLMKQKSDFYVTARYTMDESTQQTNTCRKNLAGTLYHQHNLHPILRSCGRSFPKYCYRTPSRRIWRTWCLLQKLLQLKTKGRQFYTSIPKDVPPNLILEASRYAKITDSMVRSWRDVRQRLQSHYQSSKIYTYSRKPQTFTKTHVASISTCIVDG